MKAILVALLSGCFVTPLPAQSIAGGQPLIQKKCGTQHVHLPLEKYGRNYPPLFHEIKVLDARADTARIGIVRNGNYAENEILLQSPAGPTSLVPSFDSLRGS